MTRAPAPGGGRQSRPLPGRLADMSLHTGATGHHPTMVMLTAIPQVIGAIRSLRQA